MPYSTIATPVFPEVDPRPDALVIDQSAPHYGVAARDIFSGAGWTPVEPVRARDWHDIGAGGDVRASETTFD